MVRSSITRGDPDVTPSSDMLCFGLRRAGQFLSRISIIQLGLMRSAT